MDFISKKKNPWTPTGELVLVKVGLGEAWEKWNFCWCKVLLSLQVLHTTHILMCILSAVNFLEWFLVEILSILLQLHFLDNCWSSFFINCKLLAQCVLYSFFQLIFINSYFRNIYRQYYFFYQFHCNFLSIFLHFFYKFQHYFCQSEGRFAKYNWLVAKNRNRFVAKKVGPCLLLVQFEAFSVLCGLESSSRWLSLQHVAWF